MFSWGERCGFLREHCHEKNEDFVSWTDEIYILQDVHFHGNKILSFYYQIGFPKKSQPRIGRWRSPPGLPPIPPSPGRRFVGLNAGQRSSLARTYRPGSATLQGFLAGLMGWSTYVSRDFWRVDFKREETKKTQVFTGRGVGLGILVDETFWHSFFGLQMV